jgi:hypothetical protein
MILGRPYYEQINGLWLAGQLTKVWFKSQEVQLHAGRDRSRFTMATAEPEKIGQTVVVTGPTR